MRDSIFFGDASKTSPASDDVPVSELSLERWRSTFDANLTATFLTARGFLRQLEGDGALVLVGSTAGLFGEAGHADYAAAKSAILGGNSARLYRVDVKSAQRAITTDKIAAIKGEYVAMGGLRSNTRYGYVAPARA